MYLKTDDSTVSQYTRRAMRPFRPSDRQLLKTYYEVPADVLEDRHRLTEWAEAAAPLRGRRAGQRSRRAVRSGTTCCERQVIAEVVTSVASPATCITSSAALPSNNADSAATPSPRSPFRNPHPPR